MSYIIQSTQRPETGDIYTTEECSAYLPDNERWIRHRGNYISVGPFLRSWEKITEWSKARLAYATSDYMDLLRKKGVSPPPAPEEQDLAPQQDPDAHDLGDIRVDKELNYYIRRGGDYHEVKLNVMGEPHIHIHERIND